MAVAADKTLYLEESDSFEFIRGLDRDTVFITGAVFRQGAATIVADTAIWIKGERIILVKDVYIEDTVYNLAADRVVYDLRRNSADAIGDTVVLISHMDSILAKGTNAFYNRDSSIFRMWDRPTVFINFQDTSAVTQIDADKISIESKNKIGYADGNVIIKQQDSESNSGRAIIYVDDEILLLLENPKMIRGQSEIIGDTLILYAKDSKLERVMVSGNGVGNFKEPTQKDSTVFDITNLKAAEIDFRFKYGQLDNILASGQAYSFYNPGSIDSTEIVKNNVSGDTLRLFMNNGELSVVEVIGGAEGEYFTGKYQTKDTIRSFVEDTVVYASDSIRYSLTDSVITLNGDASVKNKTVALTAYKINYNTARELVTAYDDSTVIDDTTFVYRPVLLKDGSEEILGSYLEYSMNTEKGMIRKSRSEYEQAYYRGGELFREEKDVYYVEDGCYTTCDHEEPHFHFQSKNMKMIQEDKIIARPVVFYVEKLPLFIVPYYVFPTKPGRHSGFLPFSIGNYQRGDGYVHNVGYYWAASEYWDVLGALDYTENLGFNYRGQFRYNLRYVLSGSVTGNYANEARYIGINEQKSKRWNLRFDHSHTLSPTFSIKADGTFISDKNYYSDYSTNLDDRTNRVMQSKASISKKFGNASLSAQFTHDDYLDQERRVDRLPTASFSLPTMAIFGSSAKDASGKKIDKWYSKFTFGYRVNLNNYNDRKTDTTGFKSRKEYLTMHHTPTIGLQQIKISYLKLVPSFSYQESWYKVFETDQSLAAGIDASQVYRRYAYSASVSASTDMYGTIEPNLFGLQALRHVITPSVRFSWAPEITMNDDVKKYTGVGAGGAKQKTMSFGLDNIFQAKVKSGEESKKYDLFYVNSSASYNFEAVGHKWSGLSTSFGSSMLKSINMFISASMLHELYEPGTDKLRWWSPYLQRFSISTRFNTGGIFSEYATESRSDSTRAGAGTGRQRWSISVSHSYSESGRGALFSKAHQINYSLQLALTPTTDVSFTQSYDIARQKSINKNLMIKKNLHCWEASFNWVPQGSNQGYWFKINIISIPEIKYEKRDSGTITPFSSS
ncbi:MAG: hypothetical protein CVT49_07875 [candidate division Zixibacteria bacterium HGW-Zixibacteria-1]|nr:MAG: hypothetical protein CVT49_07875 [candidate division Zixibacteria bacterium HGW-Zixibacteria-1]